MVGINLEKTVQDIPEEILENFLEMVRKLCPVFNF